MKPLNIAIVGCGEISTPYGATISAYPDIHILGATDLALERASNFVKSFGGQVYPILDDLLSDPKVEAVVDLSSQGSHSFIIEQSLRAGKHVHAEKPLALTYERAKTLSNLARQLNLRLSCSPSR